MRKSKQKRARSIRCTSPRRLGRGKREGSKLLRKIVRKKDSERTGVRARKFPLAAQRWCSRFYPFLFPSFLLLFPSTTLCEPLSPSGCLPCCPRSRHCKENQTHGSVCPIRHDVSRNCDVVVVLECWTGTGRQSRKRREVSFVNVCQMYRISH